MVAFASGMPVFPNQPLTFHKEGNGSLQRTWLKGG